MKSALLLLVLVMTTSVLCAQSASPRVYNPEADADAQLDEAIDRASVQGKHVLAVIGGNWCGWCLKLHQTFTTDTRIDSVLTADYVVLHVNYSKENKNLRVMKRLGHPERFGFPVLVVLDGQGSRIHTQDSGLLETESGHNPDSVLRLLRMWGPAVMDPSIYH